MDAIQKRFASMCVAVSILSGFVFAGLMLLAVTFARVKEVPIDATNGVIIKDAPQEIRVDKFPDPVRTSSVQVAMSLNRYANW